MKTRRVLVTFSSQSGSTAGIAEVLAAELSAAGLSADCRPVADVADVAPYGAVIVGSGVFLARRRSDGGGFLARHADALREREVWLFSAGPIGAPEADVADDPLADEAPVVRVAHAIGARGAATFGTSRALATSSDELLSPNRWSDPARARAWARSIAAELRRIDALGAAARASAKRPAVPHPAPLSRPIPVTG